MLVAGLRKRAVDRLSVFGRMGLTGCGPVEASLQHLSTIVKAM